MNNALSPAQASKLANSAYATLGSKTPTITAAQAAGAYREEWAIDTSTAFTGKTGIHATTNFGYCAFGKSAARMGECLISVRGTDMPSSADWLTNVSFAGDRGPNGYMVHSGFNRLAASILPQIKQALQGKDPSTIHLVGHSLGGATATLLADSLKSHVDLKLYTFGAPRAGGIEHSRYLSQKIGINNIFRVYHDTDPVPMVPVFPYGHCPAGQHGFLLKGSGMIISPGAHNMALYENNSQGSWGAMETIPHRRFSLETVDDVLEQAGTIPGGFLSSLLMQLIVKALGMILDAAGAIAGLTLFGAATIADQIAWILSKGIQVVGATADTMQNLIEQIMRFLGIVTTTATSFSESFLRWLSMRLFAVINELARQAVRRLSGNIF